MADLLNIGRSGLNVSKKALETTGHNISNANTEGYSRQRVLQEANFPNTKDGLNAGTGARVKSVHRIHDQHVEKRLIKATTDFEYFKERSAQLEQIENIFNEIDSEGLHNIINTFYNSFRELANQAENETIRSVVRDKANLVVRDFRRIAETLEDVSRTIDKKIETEVSEINSLLSQVANLNRKIRSLEASGDETGDLRDQRDKAVLELSKTFKLHTYEDNKGRYMLEVDGLGTLVSAAEIQALKVGTVSKEESANNLASSVEIYFASRPTSSISSRFKGGRMHSLLAIRNVDLKEMREKIDSVAFEFANTVNAIHRRGVVGRKIDPNSPEKTSGIDFFAKPKALDGAARELDLSQDIKNDLRNISTALTPNSPGDNRVAVAISKLQHEKFMANGTATIEEEYLKIIGNIGIQAAKANLDSEQSEGLLAQTRNIKERISGVSIDEETANMIRYQQAFEASARVMSTADEMFQTVLGIKKL